MVGFFPAEFFSFSAPISKINKLGVLVWGYSTIDWQTRTHISYVTTDSSGARALGIIQMGIH